MKKEMSKFIVPSIYVGAIALIITSVIMILNGVNKYNEIPEYDYAVNGLFDNSVPVAGKENKIIRPYISEEVKIGKYFYDFEGDKTEQEKSLIFYENTYMQNSGVDYYSTKVFDIVAILDGEVESVKKDDILGNVVKIKHTNDLYSVYQGIENVLVQEGAQLVQGDIIAVSGESTVNTEYKSSLHFEIYYKGELMDPENFYSLSIEDFR